MLPPHQSRPSSLRRQLFVAPRAQGRLLLWITIYCVVAACLIAGLFVLGQLVAGDPVDLAGVLLTLGLSLVIAVPLVLFGAARASNHLVGPLARAQGAMRRLAEGEEVTPLEIRCDDDWREWMEDFNTPSPTNSP